MTMQGTTIAFFCPRINLLKLYAPVLAELAKRAAGLRPAATVCLDRRCRAMRVI